MPAGEWICLTAICVAMVCMPWPLGSMRAPAQVTDLVLAAIAFGATILRRDIPALRRLSRFPPFWIGAALMIYIAIQALNPSYRYESDGVRWWLRSVPHVRFLPSGIEVPFSRVNAWRMLIIYASAWLLFCAVSTGLTSRRSLRLLLGVAVANALALTAVLVIQRTSAGPHFPNVLGDLTPYDLTASFIYRNHAGAYLALAVFAALALAVWNAESAIQRLKRSSPAGAWALIALALSGAVAFTFSRGALLNLLAAAAALGIWYLIRRRSRSAAARGNPKATALLVGGFAGVLLMAFSLLDFSTIAFRFNVLLNEHGTDPSVFLRVQAREATWEMMKDHGVRGIGAGGFRDLFTVYTPRFPDLYQGGAAFWEHAHCDWLEIPVEMGLVGDALMAGVLIWAGARLVRGRFWQSSIAAPLIFGCAQTVVHASYDFPYQCPAILVLWCILLATAINWSGLRTSDVG